MKFAVNSINLFLLAALAILPQSLSAYEEYNYSRDEDGVNHYFIGLNGIIYDVRIDTSGTGYDDNGDYIEPTVEAVLIRYSRALGIDDPISYWSTDSVLDIGSFYLAGPDVYLTTRFPEMEDLLYYLYGSIPVTTIESGAFCECTDLRDVRISSTVKHIGDGAFRGSSIRTLDIGDDYDEPIEIGKECCWSCIRLNSVRISRDIEEIPYGMFMNCPALSYAQISSMSPLKKLGALAFANCTSLTSFYASRGMEVIGKGAFANCYALKMVWQPQSTNTARIIGDYAFSNCYSLEYYNFNNVIQSIGSGAFINCRGLTHVVIPSSVTTVGNYTFAGCSGLTFVKLHDAMTSIGKRAFSACYSLNNVDIPNSVSFIDEAAFNGSKSYYEPWDDQNLRDTTDLCVACSEESYEEYRGAMKKITIGESLDSVALHAFGGIIPDTIICLADTPPACGGYWVFSRQAYNNTVLCVPRVLVESYASATCWENFLNIEGIEAPGDGDVNGDGSINVSDAIRIIQQILNDQEPQASADVNGDGSINISDAIQLISKILNEP